MNALHLEGADHFSAYDIFAVLGKVVVCKDEECYEYLWRGDETPWFISFNPYPSQGFGTETEFKTLLDQAFDFAFPNEDDADGV